MSELIVSGMCLRIRPVLVATLLLGAGWPLFAQQGNRFQPPPNGPHATLQFDSEPHYEVRQVQMTEAEIPAQLWIQALKTGKRSLVCQAAEAFIVAHRENLPGIPENLGDVLLEAFMKTNDAISRETLAAALVEFDVQSSAQQLANALSEENFDLAKIVEPALARWNSADVLERNRRRIADPTVQPLWLRHAIIVLGAGQDVMSREALMEFVMDRTARSDVRMLAAKSLGQIFSDGLVGDADVFVNTDSDEDPLAVVLALELLENHRQNLAVAVLDNLMKHDNSTVQSRALSILQSIGNQHVIDVATREKLNVDHDHSGLRRTIIESSYSIGDLDAVNRLAGFLDDVHPENRQLASDALFALAQKDEAFKSAVSDQVRSALNSDSWRVLEKAVLLATGLDLNETSPRMADLLDFDRSEVAAASAYALKVFSDPQHLARAHQRLADNVDRSFDVTNPHGHRDFLNICAQTQQLSEFIANENYQPADQVLRRFIPKKEEDRVVISSELTRAVAIWTLGHLHKGDPEQDLGEQLKKRLDDNSPSVPESETVREASVYALTWMRYEGAIGSFKIYTSRKGINRSKETASAWGLAELTGETTPLPEPIQASREHDWFLEPVSDQGD